MRKNICGIRLLALLFVALICNGPAHACATAPKRGSYVQIVDESAVIVWDARTHTEHFIRRASFRGDADDFGFLVPTPSVPKLAGARDSLFNLLEARILPEVVERKVTGFRLVSLLFHPDGVAEGTKAAGDARPSVRVLDAQKVAGYDAVVLEANDAQALNNWLKAHGYDSRPALVMWLAPYVAAHWKITAFKVGAEGRRQSALDASAVRMSFITDQPFFPYHEPADQRTGGLRNAGRSLRIFFLGTERASGTTGMGNAARPWLNRTVWAGALPEADRGEIAAAGALAPADLPGSFWLTTFDDFSNPRPGSGDLFFSRSPDPSPVKPPPFVNVVDTRIPIPVEALAAAAIGMIAFALRLGPRNRKPVQRTARRSG